MDEKLPIEIQAKEANIRLFTLKAKAIISLMLMLLAGLYVVLIPILIQSVRFLALIKGNPLPPHDWLTELTCATGILAILCWGFNAVLPILQLLSRNTLLPFDQLEITQEEKTPD